METLPVPAQLIDPLFCNDSWSYIPVSLIFNKTKTQAETVVVTGNPLFVLEVNLRIAVSVRIMSHERLMSGLSPSSVT